MKTKGAGAQNYKKTPTSHGNLVGKSGPYTTGNLRHDI